MMLSTQAARMGSVHTTLRKIGCRAAKNKRSLSSFVERDRSSNLFLERPRLAVREQYNYAAAAAVDILSRNKSTAASAKHHDDFEDEKDEATAPRVIMAKKKNEMVYHQYNSANAATVATITTKTTATDTMVTSSLHLGGAAAVPAQHLPDAAAAMAWMINLGRNDDKEWLTGPRGREWFTGTHPRECPGVDEMGKIRSLSLPNLSGVTRKAAREYFDNSWTLYETLFAGLNGEEGFFRPPPHGLRYPQIFYYGHTACLYINKLRVAGVLSKAVNPYFESIFEVGVDEMLWDDMHKNDMIWPTVSEVHEYRKQVYDTVVECIETHPSLDDINGNGVRVDQSHPMWALFMGFEHERIHLETSSVLFRETPCHLVQTPANWPPMHPSASKQTTACYPLEGVDYPVNGMIPVHSETVDLGKPANFPSFGWDNEYGERNLNVPPFQASKHMITNGEYWQFVADGGYRNKEYWCDDGWAWRTHRNLKWPFFWEQAGPAGSHEFQLRTIFKVVSMPWSWPVDVNYYEAKAYCSWKTLKDGSPTSRPYRLLTEAEHHVIRHREHNIDAARKNVSADKVMVTSGRDFANDAYSGANLNLAFSSQNPVDYFEPSETGHLDTTGSAWEWTEDHFNPLKGFEVHHVYDDFSTPCFDGKHSIIVGGSFISTGDEASVFARFHFRPHFLQHSGFRLVASDADAPATHLYAGNFEGQAAARTVKDDELGTSSPAGSSVPVPENVYESAASLHMYLGLHYPTSGDAENVPPILPHNNALTHGIRFAQRVADLLISLNPKRNTNSALDIGCAVGGTSFELAKSFKNVDAFDFSAAFINTAKRMQNGENVHFNIPVEAELYEMVRAVHGDGVNADVRSRVNFFTGDACEISEMSLNGTLSSYDAVSMSNLLCRLPDPMACLNGLPRIVNNGGVVLLVTPFSWLTEFTPRSKWMGGFYDPVSKEPIRSKDILQATMEKNGFEKIHQEEVPLVIREHQRKYQYIISEATGWRKMD